MLKLVSQDQGWSNPRLAQRGWDLYMILKKFSTYDFWIKKACRRQISSNNPHLVLYQVSIKRFDPFENQNQWKTTIYSEFWCVLAKKLWIQSKTPNFFSRWELWFLDCILSVFHLFDLFHQVNLDHDSAQEIKQVFSIFSSLYFWHLNIHIWNLYNTTLKMWI